MVKRLCVLVGWLLIGSLPITAQSLDLEVSFSDGATSARIPFELASSKVHVRGVFAGAAGPESVWLLLDSGANMSILDKPLADRLGLELRGGGTASGAAGGASFTFAFARAPDLSFPGLEIASRAVAVIVRKTQGANGHDSEGLLGADLFRAFVVDIDYPNRVMTLHDPESFRYQGGGVEIPVTFDANDKWQAPAQITLGEKVIDAQLIIDTGARGTVGFTAPFAEKHGLVEALPKKVMGTVGVGIGGEVRHWVGRLDRLKLGGVGLGSVPVTLAPEGAKGAYGRADRDGILGGEILERFRVIFDRQRERLILESSPASEKPFDWDAAGLFLASEAPEFETPVVLSVAKGTPAETAGLKVGDRIMAIDSLPVSEHSLDEVRRLLRVSGRTYRIEVERAGASIQLELVTRRLI